MKYTFTFCFLLLTIFNLSSNTTLNYNQVEKESLNSIYSKEFINSTQFISTENQNDYDEDKSPLIDPI